MAGSHKNEVGDVVHHVSQSVSGEGSGPPRGPRFRLRQLNGSSECDSKLAKLILGTDVTVKIVGLGRNSEGRSSEERWFRTAKSFLIVGTPLWG